MTYTKLIFLLNQAPQLTFNKYKCLVPTEKGVSGIPFQCPPLSKFRPKVGVGCQGLSLFSFSSPARASVSFSHAVDESQRRFKTSSTFAPIPSPEPTLGFSVPQDKGNVGSGDEIAFS